MYAVRHHDIFTYFDLLLIYANSLVSRDVPRQFRVGGGER